MKRNKRGFTLIELLVVIAIIALLMGLLLPALAKALGNARVRKDQGQLKGVTNTYSIFAEADKSEMFPKPGVIDRGALNVQGNTFGGTYHGAQGNNLQIQGKGPEDYEANISGWLHSAMIGQRFYEPSILISANENNPMVAAKGDSGANPDEIPYDYDAISPGDDVYWDTLFSGDISGGGVAGEESSHGVVDVCHTSYANLAICGHRAKKRWTNGDNHTIILSSRGTQMGEDGSGNQGGTTDNDDHNDSPTLMLYGPTSQWEGIFSSADGSTHYAQTMYFDELQYQPKDDLLSILDNAFDAEFWDYLPNDYPADTPHNGGPSGDIWMVLNVKATKTDAECYWDVLLQ